MRLLLSLCLAAATASAQPAFTVASVKSNEFLADKRPIIVLNPGRLTLTGLTLAELIQRAYDLKPYQLHGPEWMYSWRYNIAATMPPDTPEPIVWQMVQSLLTERLELKIRRAPEDVPVYAMLIGKSGPKIKPSASGDTKLDFKNGLKATGITMPQLANLLTKGLDRPVVDQTDLTGKYDLALEFAPGANLALINKKGARELGGKEEGEGASVFTAMQEQLGLRLEGRKMPIEVLTVESALKVPTEN